MNGCCLGEAQKPSHDRGGILSIAVVAFRSLTLEPHGLMQFPPPRQKTARSRLAEAWLPGETARRGCWMGPCMGPGVDNSRVWPNKRKEAHLARRRRAGLKESPPCPPWPGIGCWLLASLIPTAEDVICDPSERHIARKKGPEELR
jgi:hypothetical protein